MSLVEVYGGLGVRRLAERHAQAIVAEAMPHAVATLGLSAGTVLPVSATAVVAEVARGGSIIPAWPMRRADGSVVIEYVDDWGALLAGFLVARDGTAPSTSGRGRGVRVVEWADSTVLTQRVWIGIANDVLQLFVADPPAGTYSMVRHHALMLVAATAWLGPAAISAWHAAHVAGGAAFVRSCDRPLHEAIEAAERGLDTLLEDERAHLPAARALAWLDNDSAARKLYLEYLGAASLGVAALLRSMLASDLDTAVWLTRAVKDLHANPDFNRAWIEECAFARGGSSA